MMTFQKKIFLENTLNHLACFYEELKMKKEADKLAQLWTRAIGGSRGKIRNKIREGKQMAVL